jgi:expansin (peptidoglycan-binding protein)
MMEMMEIPGGSFLLARGRQEGTRVYISDYFAATSSAILATTSQAFSNEGMGRNS